MTPEERQAAQARDAATAELWFIGPGSFTALAARDRRALLAEVEALNAALHRAFNQFENITVAKSLDDAHARAHEFIGWAYRSLPNYTPDIDAQERTT